VGADYSTGESFAYQYDAVGNRTAMTDTSSVHTYTYDAANRLTSVDDVTYTWDDRGNLVNDGTFTYTYNAAWRMVRAESVTVTLVYTYNAQGLRVAQSVDGDITAFVWDWASGIPEMLSEGNHLYLVGHETLGAWDGSEWAYYLPDALGSVRQATDDTGTVTDSREWTPFGVEVGTAQGGLGYTGEWFDGSAGFTYLRARWYDGRTGRFTRRDPLPGQARWPQSQNPYPYAGNNPVQWGDPSGLQCCILSWEDPYPAFFPWGDPYLQYGAWDLPWPGSISIAEIEVGLIPLPDWLPIDIAQITLWEGGDIEFWMRYIKQLQDGESWRVRTCLSVEGFKLSLHWEKMYLVDESTTLVLAGWRQDLVIVTTSRYPPPQRHISLGWNVEPQPGPWDYSEDLDVQFHSNGEWPYDDLEW